MVATSFHQTLEWEIVILQNLKQKKGGTMKLLLSSSSSESVLDTPWLLPFLFQRDAQILPSGYLLHLEKLVGYVKYGGMT